MLRNTRRGMVLWLLMFAMMPVMAAPPAECGAFSVEAKGGYAKVDEEVDGQHDNDGLMYGVAVDYYVACDVAVELGYTYFPKVKYTGGEIKGNDAFHLAAVGRMPVSKKIALSGKLGLAQTRAEIPSGLGMAQGKRKETAFYAAFGVDGDVSSSLSWLVDASMVTEKNDVAAKYGIAAGLRFQGL